MAECKERVKAAMWVGNCQYNALWHGRCYWHDKLWQGIMEATNDKA